MEGQSEWGSLRGRSLGGVLALVLAQSALACTPDARPLPAVPERSTGGGSAELERAPTGQRWSYTGETGPSSWASLSPEFADCGGEGQSPVDLPLEGIGKQAVDPALAVSLNLPSSPLQAQSDGRLVTLLGSSELTLLLDGRRNSIEKIEIHVPAEHQLGGARLDAELVLHAQGPDGRLTLLSLLYRTGAESAAWAPLLAQLPKAGVYGAHPLGPQATLGNLVPETAEILAYEGSLSTPPCTAHVSRLVVAHVGELSSGQLARLRESVPDSARPTVPLGQRPIEFRSLSKASPSTKTSDKQTP